MRDVVALIALGMLLGIAVASWAALIAPSEWSSPLWKGGYWPYSVETSVRDR